MAIDKGTIKTSANYDVQIQAPLDGRAVRPTKADLINKESWSYDGSTIYAYEGMQVFVEDEKKTYYLKDISRITAADYSGWVLMGTGAGQEIAGYPSVMVESVTELEMSPNTCYFGTLGQSLSISLQEPADSTITNEYCGIFVCLSDIDVAFSDTINWTNGAPSFAAWTVVEISILAMPLNGYTIYFGVHTAYNMA